MKETTFDITAAAKEYRDDVAKLGYPDDPYEINIDDVENAFIAGAQWAFDMIEKHCKGSYITSLETKIEEG